MGECKDIESWWAHFVWRRHIRYRRAPRPEPRYLGNCYAALAKVGTFVACCTACHASHNWREVSTEDGWYQVCCRVEDACRRRLRKHPK